MAAFSSSSHCFFFFFFFFGVTGELSTLCQMAKVPNEPSLRQNSGSTTMCPSDQSMASNPQTGQAKRFGAMTTSRGSKAGRVMTQVCQPSHAENTSCACNTCVQAYEFRQLAVRCDRLNCRAKQYQVSISSQSTVAHGKSVIRDTSKQSWMHFVKVGTVL